MKKILLSAIILLFAATSSLSAQNKGVNFQSGTLKELLEKAGKADKYLFVDVYATWCGPCKQMANSVFPQQKVGEFFNKTFINAKFDAEKGEGVDVAKRYAVKGYPTFLILNSKGEEIGRLVGASDGTKFIERVEEVLTAIAQKGK